MIPLKEGHYYIRNPFTGLQTIVSDDDFERVPHPIYGWIMQPKKDLWIKDRTRSHTIEFNFPCESPIPSVIAKQTKPEILFQTEDLDGSVIYEGDSYEQAEKAFLELHPIFHLESVKHFITKLC